MSDDRKPVGPLKGWTHKSRETVYQTAWFKIHRDQVDLKVSAETTVGLREKEITYSYLEHPGAVFVVPVTKENKIVLIRHYRYTVDDVIWSVPSGGIGDKLHMTLEEAARSELREEAGMIGGTAEYLGMFYTAPGIMDLKAHYFVITGVTEGDHDREETEAIEDVRAFTFEEARELVYSNKMTDGESAFAILLALQKIQK